MLQVRSVISMVCTEVGRRPDCSQCNAQAVCPYTKLCACSKPCTKTALPRLQIINILAQGPLAILYWINSVICGGIPPRYKIIEVRKSLGEERKMLWQWWNCVTFAWCVCVHLYAPVSHTAVTPTNTALSLCDGWVMSTVYNKCNKPSFENV